MIAVYFVASGSIVMELFLATLVWFRCPTRPRVRWLLLPVAAYVAFGLVDLVRMLSHAGVAAVFYAMAFAVSTLTFAKAFGIRSLDALVLGTLGYCTQHFWSDVSFAVLADMPKAAYFYFPYIAILAGGYVLTYLLVGRRFEVDEEVASARLPWVVGCLAAVFFVIVFSSLVPGGMTRVLYVYDALCTALIGAVLVAASRMDGLRRDIATQEAVWEAKRQQYELTRENVDLINIKCHDIRKSVGRMGEGALSQRSLDEIRNSIRVYDAQVKTGNDALDVVLTEKSLLCSKEGIDLTCMADGARLSKVFEDDDLYFLMENVLDNAIEAVLGLDDPERRSITITARAEGELLAIREDNFYVGQLELADGLPQTTKGDARNHGFGMRSIRRCVERYGGELRVHASDGVFSLVVLVPMFE